MKPEKEKIDEVVDLAVKAFETECNLQNTKNYLQDINAAKGAYFEKFKSLFPNFDAVDIEKKAKEIYSPLVAQYFGKLSDKEKFKQEYQKKLDEFIIEKQKELAARGYNPFYKPRTQKENNSISLSFLCDVITSPVFINIGISFLAIGTALLLLGIIISSSILMSTGAISALIGTIMFAAEFFTHCLYKNEDNNCDKSLSI